MNSAPPLTIEVFADVWCPFAYVGLRTIASELERRGRSDVGLHVRAWPLERVNGAPMNPAKTEEHIHHLRASVAPDLFRGFNTETFPTTTIPAMALTACAYRTSETAGIAMAFAVREALFENGLNIGDDGVLQRIAAQGGVTMPAADDFRSVIDDWHEGQRRGVIGSPHFFCGDLQGFCPSLDISRDPEHGMTIAMDSAGVKVFLDECLARP